MYKLENENISDAIFITVEGASRLCNLGRNTVRAKASECGAVRRYGRSIRIHKQTLLEYLDTFEDC